MKKNIGKIDKIIRSIIGSSIIAVGLYYQSWWGIIGLAPITLAILGWCPAYVPGYIYMQKKVT